MKENNAKIVEEYGYGLLQECDLCHNEKPIRNLHIKYDYFKGDYILFNGKQFLCEKCRD